jgi:hypothetical protein
MDLDPSLAYTAIIEMRPGLGMVKVHDLTARLAAAMTAANPRDRWAFARQWLNAELAEPGTTTPERIDPR